MASFFPNFTHVWRWLQEKVVAARMPTEGSKIYRFAWEFLLRHLVMEKRESERAVDFREAFQGEGIPLLG
jgi:hypothetical protein